MTVPTVPLYLKKTSVDFNGAKYRGSYMAPNDDPFKPVQHVEGVIEDNGRVFEVSSPAPLERRIRDGFGPQKYPDIVITLSVIRDKLRRDGAPLARRAFEAEVGIIDMLNKTELPAPLRDPYAEVNIIKSLPRGSGKAVLDWIRQSNSQIYGSFAQSLQTSIHRTPGDIDLVTPMPLKQAGNELQAVLRQYAKNPNDVKDEYEYYKGNVSRAVIRVKNGGKYIEAIDMHPPHVEHMPLYVPVRQPVNANGVNMQPLTEQIEFKTLASMFMQHGKQGWTVLPKAHRHKDLPDLAAALRSEITALPRGDPRAIALLRKLAPIENLIYSDKEMKAQYIDMLRMKK